MSLLYDCQCKSLSSILLTHRALEIPPGLNYLATVYNGIDLSLYPLQEGGGDHLVFLGRIHPDKGVHLAIEVARLSGLPLLIAGIIQDRTYFREQVEPHLDQTIRYIGP